MKMKVFLLVIFIALLVVSYRLTFSQKKLTLDKVKVELELNPSGKAPLSALAKLTLIDYPTDDLQVKISVKGEATDAVEIKRSYALKNYTPEDDAFTLPVLGLYPDYENQVNFEIIKAGETQLSFNEPLTTQKLDEQLVVPFDISVNQLPADDQKIYLVDNLKIAFDQQGEIRWAYTGDSYLNYGKLKNGNLLIMSAEDIRFRYHYKKFYEVSMLGEIIHTYDISKYYGHHDVWEMQAGPYAGHLLVAANEAAPGLGPDAGNDGVMEEDWIILIDRNTGAVLKEWDLKKLFDEANPDGHRLPQAPNTHVDDWIHFNSLYYDDRDNSIVFSARHQSAVVKYDFDSGALVWIIADNSGRQWDQQKNFYGQVIADYVFTPVDANGEVITDPGKVNFWPYGQHAAKRIDGIDGIDGIDTRSDAGKNLENILMYDNGNYRNYFQYGRNNQSSQNGSKPVQFSRAVEYLIDKENFTIQLVWEFDYNKELYTVATGSVDLLENQNRLIGFMWTSKDKKTPRIVELSPEDQILFEAWVNEGKTFYYQIEKFDLYQGL